MQSCIDGLKYRHLELLSTMRLLSSQVLGLRIDHSTIKLKTKFQALESHCLSQSKCDGKALDLHSVSSLHLAETNAV